MSLVVAPGNFERRERLVAGTVTTRGSAHGRSAVVATFTIHVPCGSSSNVHVVIPARPADLPHIAAIELAAARLLAGHAPEPVLAEVTPLAVLNDVQRGGRLWVVVFDDTPVGFAHVEIIEPNAAHLAEIDVHPDHGRRGLGRRLVWEVCRWASAQGYAAVTLTTFRDLPWNMPFYQRLGFEELALDALTPALHAVRADETRRGLDPARRVVMRWAPLTAGVDRDPASAERAISTGFRDTA